MRQEQQYTHIMAKIAEASIDCREWGQVLETIKPSLDAEVLCLGDYNRSTGNMRLIEAVGATPEYKRLYETRYMSQNPWLIRATHSQKNQVILGQHVLDPSESNGEPFLERWLRPQGLAHQMCTTIDLGNDMVCFLDAMRQERNGPFDESTVQLMHFLIPHLSRSVERNTHLWRLAIALSIMDCLPMAVMAVDADRRCFFVNLGAKRVLDEGKGLCLEGGRLTTGAPNTLRQLEQATQRAASAPSDSSGLDASDTLIIRRGGNLSPLRVVVMPLPRTLRKVVAQADHVALVFVTAGEVLGALPATVLRTAYGLTVAERKLALKILNGHRLEEAAQALGVSTNTARTHMKRIFAKMGVSSQTDMVRLVLLGAIDKDVFYDTTPAY